ncbi:MAG TPA: hypothetical protein PKX92_04280 [Edaphocola sp.]|nr:hypothetical protein [Edaphocola sp.]
MKKLKSLMLLLMIAPIVSNSQSNLSKKSDVATFLFKNVKTKLTITEQNEIASFTKFKINTSKTKIVGYAGANDYLELFPLDLNNDGIEEIIILGNNPELSGPGGESWLFIKDKSNHFQGGYIEEDNSLSIGWNAEPIILTEKTNGWPNLTMSIPGMEMPIFTWKGKGYKLTKRVNSMNSNLEMKDIRNASKEYQNKIKP